MHRLKNRSTHQTGARIELSLGFKLTHHCSPGEAAGDNGRVWKIYRDRVEKVDDDLLEGWNDTLNMLLVFVRLSGDALLISHSECRLVYSRRRALHSSLRCKSLG